MKKSERKAKKAGASTASNPPLTVSRPELIRNGSDRNFRRLVHSMFGLFARHEAIRSGHGARIGLAGIEYTLLITIGHLCAELGAVSVSQVAGHLYLSGAFVTKMTNKLVEMGLVNKLRDPDDGRKVQLSVTEKGLEKLAALAPVQRQVNDVEFEPLSAEEFDLLLDMMLRMIESSDRAINLQNYLASVPAAPQENG